MLCHAQCEPSFGASVLLWLWSGKLDMLFLVVLVQLFDELMLDEVLIHIFSHSKNNGKVDRRSKFFVPHKRLEIFNASLSALKNIVGDF